MSSGRLYISRNITFDEESFPYKHSPQTTPSPRHCPSDFRPLLVSSIPPLIAALPTPPDSVATSTAHPSLVPSPPTSSPAAHNSPAGDGPAVASYCTPAPAARPTLPCHPHTAPAPHSSRNLVASSPSPSAASAPIPEPIISSSPVADNGSPSLPSSSSSPLSSPSSTPPRNPRFKSINALIYGSSPSLIT